MGPKNQASAASPQRVSCAPPRGRYRKPLREFNLAPTAFPASTPDMCLILIVDDHDDVRGALGAALRDAGHEVELAADGDVALSWLSAHAEKPPCLIILDLRMPKMDGWDFLQAFRERTAGAHLPVIVLSGLFKQGDLKPVLNAQAFWSKPVDPDQLENVHEHCPAHRQSWPPASAPL